MARPSGSKARAGATDKSSEALRRATGRDYDEWFSRLDEWGAPGRPFREISDWLTGTHAISKWWSQKLIVEYEQARGLRPAGIRPNGTFEVSASKTIDASVGRLFDAFVDTRTRKRWLTEPLVLRESRVGKQARFEKDGTKVHVSFSSKGRKKSNVVVRHELLPSARVAEATKRSWRERLMILKEMLERDPERSA